VNAEGESDGTPGEEDEDLEDELDDPNEEYGFEDDGNVAS